MENNLSILRLFNEKKVILQGLFNRRNLIWTTLLCALFYPLFGIVFLHFVISAIFPGFQKESKNSGLPKNQRKKVLIAGSNSIQGNLNFPCTHIV